MHARRAASLAAMSSSEQPQVLEDCPICLEPLQDVEGADVVALPCAHRFHAACIKKHVSYVCRQGVAASPPSCPCCRDRIEVVYVEAPLMPMPTPMRAEAAAVCLAGCRACFYVFAGAMMVATLILVGVMGERFAPK
jgi:hypothetical protein